MKHLMLTQLSSPFASVNSHLSLYHACFPSMRRQSFVLLGQIPLSTFPLSLSILAHSNTDPPHTLLLLKITAVGSFAAVFHPGSESSNFNFSSPLKESLCENRCCLCLIRGLEGAPTVMGGCPSPQWAIWLPGGSESESERNRRQSVQNYQRINTRKKKLQAKGHSPKLKGPITCSEQHTED